MEFLFTSSKYRKFYLKGVENMTDKNFEKINTKIVISILQFAPVQNFSHFEDLQIMGPNLPLKNMNDKNFGKININFVTSIYRNVRLPQISVNLENFRFWDQISPNKYE